MDLSYDYEHLGSDTSLIRDIANGNHPFAKKLKEAKKPLIIVGANQLARKDGSSFLTALHVFANSLSPADKNWKVWNVLQTNAAQTAALDVGYTPGMDAVYELQPKVLFLLGADGGVVDKEKLPKDCFIVYQGHHGDVGAQQAHAILPGAAYTEKQGTPLPYDNLDELRARLEDVAPHLVRYGRLEAANFFSIADALLKNASVSFDGSKVDVGQKKLSDFFMTDPITRASPTMAKCVTAAKKQATQAAH